MNKRIIALSILIVISIFIAGVSISSSKVKPEKKEAKTETVEVPKAPARREIVEASSVRIEVPNILQLPELPAGCEMTSCTMVLNYLGIPTGKLELLDYLEMDNEFEVIDGKTYKASYWEKFVGDPRTDCYGCFSPVIHKTLDSYLVQKGYSDKFKVYGKIGAEPSDVYDELKRGNPVIVWATICMEDPYVAETWHVKNSEDEMDWFANEHCTVLIGFDDNSGLVSFSDPYSGYRSYPKELFEKRFKQMYSQYLVIEPIQ